LTNASTPQFFYCKVGKHCASGMFGLINPPVSNVSNDLTDQATKTSAPIQKSTAGLGGGATCQDSSMGCWIDKWAGGVSVVRNDPISPVLQLLLLEFTQPGRARPAPSSSTYPPDLALTRRESARSRSMTA